MPLSGEHSGVLPGAKGSPIPVPGLRKGVQEERKFLSQARGADGARPLLSPPAHSRGTANVKVPRMRLFCRAGRPRGSPRRTRVQPAGGATAGRFHTAAPHGPQLCGRSTLRYLPGDRKALASAACFQPPSSAANGSTGGDLPEASEHRPGPSPVHARPCWRRPSSPAQGERPEETRRMGHRDAPPKQMQCLSFTPRPSSRGVRLFSVMGFHLPSSSCLAHHDANLHRCEQVTLMEKDARCPVSRAPAGSSVLQRWVLGRCTGPPRGQDCLCRCLHFT